MLPPISQLLSDASPPPPAWLPPSLHGLYIHASRLPIVDYYRYLLHTSPVLLGCTLGVNWLLPVLLEALPWYLSRRQLSKLLRDSRNAIQHRLISSDPLSSRSLLAFALMSVMYSLLHSCEESLRSRLMLLNRLQVRRMLIERILFSEVGSLQSRYALSFGGGDSALLRTDALEAAVFADMNDTLQLFNSTLPAVFRSAYSLSLSGSELYRQRSSIHLLSILRPSVIALASEAVSLLHSRLVLDSQSLLLLRNASAGSRLVSNIVDGLGEIQVSNGQDWQLQRLDRVSREEADGKQGLTTFLSSALHSMQGRGVLDFVSEVAVVKAVMDSSGLSHEQYRAVQNDIDYVGRLIGRIYSLGREAARTVDSQHRVMAVLNLPTFRHEAAVADRSRQQRAADRAAEEQRQQQAQAAADAAAAGRQEAADAAASDGEFHFEELVVRRLWFRYGEREPWALRIGSAPAIAALDKQGKEQLDDDDDAAPDAVDGRDGSQEEHIAADTHNDDAALSGSRPSSPPVLRFQRGKTYAIIGQNRSGKSTLVQILCKLRSPLPDTEPLLDINPSASCCPSFLSLPRMQFRSVLSYIPQRPFIFPGSIEDNVRMANTQASRQEVEDAARRGGVFLFDTRTVADGAQQLHAADDSGLLRRDVTLRKPWEVNRVTEAARRLWRGLQAVWDWSRPEEAGELDDDDDDEEPRALQPLLMEDEMMGETRPHLTAAQPLRPHQPTAAAVVLSSATNAGARSHQCNRTLPAYNSAGCGPSADPLSAFRSPL